MNVQINRLWSEEVGALTCSAKKDMTVKMTSVTRTQCVQNFSLSRYTRLRGKKNTFQLVWNEELTCYPIGWPKCQRWYVSLEGRLIILRCNEKETWSMQRAAGQQGDKVTSPSAICLILYLLRYRSGCGEGRRLQLCDDLTRILQRAPDLKRRGLILKAHILRQKPPE